MIKKLLAPVCLLAGSAHAAVFINELHYDDSTIGGDVGEAIEVVATANEDLSLYRIVLYNGATPAAATQYDDDPVPAGSIVSCGGAVKIGVINYPTNGVQNGSNDAMALVGPGNSVLQFLSYEGVATASNGPAVGLTSVDIGVAEVPATAPNTSLQLGGSGSAYADFTWNGSATQTFSACNNGQTFSGGADVPPSVSSVVPGNNASGVSIASNVVVSFSEPVTVSGAWYSLQCSGNPVPAAVTGGPSNYTLDPTSDLPEGASCALTVIAAQVTDLDGAPDAMAANFNSSFTTAVDTAPSVIATIPSNGAAAFPISGNLGITFSEPVSVTAPWYTIQCSLSHAVAAVTSGGPTSYTLNPNSDLAPLETCTVTVLAAQVLDQDGAPTVMASNFVFGFTAAISAANYYASVNATTPALLRSTLHALIDDHTAFPYSSSTATDTWDVLELADQDPGNSARIVDVYRNAVHAKAGGGNSNYNREHTWPNSYGFNDAVADAQQRPFSPYTDTHMLYLSNIQYNSDRGNKPFDGCTQASGCSELTTDVNNGIGGGAGTYPGNSNWRTAQDGPTGKFEVWGRRKGDMARAILYMDVRYEGGTAANGQVEPDLIVTNNVQLIAPTPSGQIASVAYMGILDTLIAWHLADLPDAQEIARNGIVFSFQGNRNPFIDRPEWVACLWRTQCGLAPADPIFKNGFEAP